MKNIFRTSKILNRIKNTVRLFAVILSLSLLLGGCIPNLFSREEERAFLKVARNVVSDFLKNEYSGAKITNIRAETAQATDRFGLVLTEFASGQFSWKRQTYDFLVNTETKQVYTSVYLAEVAEGLKNELLQGFDIDASEAAVEDLTIYYAPYLSNVFPQKDSAEELLREILQDTEEYRVYIEIQYKGKDLPSGITERAAPFSALTSVKFYHIGEEHRLCQAGREVQRNSRNYQADKASQEVRRSHLMSSLSEEVLRIGYRQGLPSIYDYVRNQVMQQDGFYLLYNAYERILEEDVITEYVITEEDITFTVTEDYIAVDCAKDNYVMYLSAANKKAAEKYCYAFAPAPFGGEIWKGMWYAYEDRYVYSHIDHYKVPHEFYALNSVTHIIYTKSASKKPPILPKSAK